MKKINAITKHITTVLIAMVFVGFFFSHVNAQEWTWCDCYTTKPIKDIDFVQDGKIIPIYNECKDGYFITGFLQKPEENPVENGQFIIIKQYTCCKPCTKESKAKPKK